MCVCVCVVGGGGGGGGGGGVVGKTKQKKRENIDIFCWVFAKKKKRKKKKKKTFQSNNADVPEFGQVATPTVAQVATPIVAQASLVHTFGPVSVSLGEKLEKSNGLNFKRWQQKMIFYLTTLNLTRFLTEDVLQLKEDEHDIQVISAIEA